MTPASSRRRMRAATDGADRLTRLAIWLNDSRASRWIWPMMAQSVGSRDPLQIGLVPDEGAVQEFTTVSADPAFDDRVHPGRLDTAEHGPDPGVSEDGIERGGEVRSAVADHELDPVGLVAEIHYQVAGLLGGPFPSWVQGESE